MEMLPLATETSEVRTNMSDSDVDEWADAMLESARDIFRDNGEVKPTVIFLSPHEENDEWSTMTVVDITPFFSGNRGKDVLCGVMPVILAKMKAYALFHVSEAWQHAEKSIFKSESLDEMEERVQKTLDEVGGSLEFVEGRVEVIKVNFESNVKEWVHSIEIVRDDEDKPTLGKEERFGHDEDSEVHGRMIGWLRMAKRIREEEHAEMI